MSDGDDKRAYGDYVEKVLSGEMGRPMLTFEQWSERQATIQKRETQKFRPPWETPDEEGWIASWTPQVKGPGDLWMQAPSGTGGEIASLLAEASYEASYEDKYDWEESVRKVVEEGEDPADVGIGPPSPAPPPTPPPPIEGFDTFVRFEEADGYLIPIYRTADGVEYSGDPIPDRRSEDPREVPPFPLEDPPPGYRWELNQDNQWIPVQDTSERDRTQRLADISAERAFATQQQTELINWYKQQEAGRLAAEKQSRLATLAAQPASWLEYAALAQETPAIQPWMLPLMPEQYQGLQAGEAIPGFEGISEFTAAAKGPLTSGLAPTSPIGLDFSQLPELTTPSRQYQARISPSAREQFGGYRRARTGQTLADIDWRLWSQAPPSGANPGLRFTR